VAKNRQLDALLHSLNHGEDATTTTLFLAVLFRTRNSQSGSTHMACVLTLHAALSVGTVHDSTA
jgi:hypothetical protein